MQLYISQSQAVDDKQNKSYINICSTNFVPEDFSRSH